MKKTLVVIAVLMIFMSNAATAESYGLIPTLAERKPKEVAARRATLLPEPTPILVIGFEAISWYGPDASAGFAVTGKREIGGGWKRVDGTFYAGALFGVSETADETFAGAMLELAVGEIPAVSLMLRREGGSWLVNPGVNFTLVGWR